MGTCSPGRGVRGVGRRSGFDSTGWGGTVRPVCERTFCARYPQQNTLQPLRCPTQQTWLRVSQNQTWAPLVREFVYMGIPTPSLMVGLHGWPTCLVPQALPPPASSVKLLERSAPSAPSEALFGVRTFLHLHCQDWCRPSRVQPEPKSALAGCSTNLADPGTEVPPPAVLVPKV